MGKRLSSMVLILVVVASAVGAAGEEPPDPRASAAFVGDRVRLRMTGERHLLTGKVLEIDGAALVIARGREGAVLRVPLASLDRLEVARGRRNRAALGAAIGFVPGALYAAVGRPFPWVSRPPEGRPPSESASHRSRGAAFGLGFRWASDVLKRALHCRVSTIGCGGPSGCV